MLLRKPAGRILARLCVPWRLAVSHASVHSEGQLSDVPFSFQSGPEWSAVLQLGLRSTKGVGLRLQQAQLNETLKSLEFLPHRVKIRFIFRGWFCSSLSRGGGGRRGLCHLFEDQASQLFPRCREASCSAGGLHWGSRFWGAT